MTQSAKGNVTNRAETVITQFRQYDEGLKNWAVDGAPTMQDGKTVPVVFATPDRAFAAMNRLLEGHVAQKSFEPKNIPLPFISISRGRVTFDQTRFHGANAAFRKLAMSSGASPEFAYSSQFPLPWDITYQMEFWAKNRETLNAYELWAITQFKNGFETFIPVEMSEVWPSWGTKSIPFETEAIQDTSELEPQEGHRVLRFTLGLTAKAWILCDVKQIKTVQKIIQDYYLVEDCNVDLQAATADEVDSDPVTYPQVLKVTTTATGEDVETF